MKRFTAKTSGLVMPMCHFTGQNIWILKPTGFNRGRGIHVVDSIKKIKKIIKDYAKGNQSVYAPGGSMPLTAATILASQPVNHL